MYILNWKPNVEKLLAKGDINGLIKALNDGDAGLRYRAATALGEFDDDIVVQALKEALYDEHLVVRYSSADSLAKIGAQSAVTDLRRALKDKQWIMRKKAALALGKIGDESSVDVLVNTLRDEDEEVRKAAVVALQNIGGTTAVQALTDVISSIYVQYQVQYNAALALRELGPAAKPAVPALIAVLADKKSRIRDVAIWALMGIGPEASEAIPALTDLLYDSEEDWDIRYCAAEALEKIKGEESVPSEKRPFGDIRDLPVESRIIELVKRVKHITSERRGVSLEGAPAHYWFRSCGNQLIGIGESLYEQGGPDLLKATYERVCSEGHFRGRYLDAIWRETKIGWSAHPSDAPNREVSRI